MRGAIPLLPNTSSWLGAQLIEKSTGTTLPFFMNELLLVLPLHLVYAYLLAQP
jgi:hypothetical protein